MNPIVVQPPSRIGELDALFFDHLETVISVSGQLEEIGRRMVEVTSDRYADIKSSVSLDDFLAHDVAKYQKQVRHIAAEELSTPLAPFKANSIEVLEKEFEKVNHIYRYSHETERRQLLKRAREACALVSPLRVWEALKAHHDPEAQNRVAAEEHARVLGYQLAPQIYARNSWNRSLSPAEMKIVKGRVEIPISVYTDTGWGSKERRWGDNRGLRDFGKAMNFALDQLEPEACHPCGTRLVALCDAYMMNQRPVVSRERIDLGGGADVIAGFKEFKLYLPQDIAGKLNLFLAQYGQATSQ